jgi:glutaredoxin-like protein
MGLISDKDREIVRKKFSQMTQNVRLILFTQETECQFCRETRQIAEEISPLSDKITLEVYDFVKDKEKADQMSIDKIPALAILGDRDYGIRFYGIPSGYEFTSFVEDIMDIGMRKTNLSEKTKKALYELSKPVHIQVFVTPTCPYCPMAVRTAHKMAFESDKVRADVIESVEFPHLALKYNVKGVPKVVINETVTMEGAVPEPHFLEKVLEAAK